MICPYMGGGLPRGTFRRCCRMACMIFDWSPVSPPRCWGPEQVERQVVRAVDGATILAPRSKFSGGPTGAYQASDFVAHMLCQGAQMVRWARGSGVDDGCHQGQCCCKVSLVLILKILQSG